MFIWFCRLVDSMSVCLKLSIMERKCVFHSLTGVILFLPITRQRSFDTNNYLIFGNSFYCYCMILFDCCSVFLLVKYFTPMNSLSLSDFCSGSSGNNFINLRLIQINKICHKEIIVLFVLFSANSQQRQQTLQILIL